MANKNYTWYTHNESEIVNISQFIDNDLSIVQQGTMTVDELLDYTTPFGTTNEQVTNRMRIYAMYKAADLDEVDHKDSNVKGSSPFKMGTKIAIPDENLFLETALITGTNQVFPQVDQKLFLAMMHRSLLEDEGYVRVSHLRNKGLGTVKQEFPNMTIWMWIRALGTIEDNPDPTTSKEPKGKWMDVSPFIMDCDTNVDENGGNFNLKLAPIPIVATNDGWVIEDGAIHGYRDSDLKNAHVNQTGLHYYDMGVRNRGNLRRKNFLFHHLVQPNDLVFIRFETLLGESEQRRRDSTKLFLSPSDIPGRAYDMMGMVDTATMTINPQSNDIGCDISGRDFTKTIIDDGSYFYATPAHDLTGLVNTSDGMVQRLTANGRYPIIAEYSYRSIQWSLQWIMNQIAGIRVVPDSVFAGYGKRRVKRYKIENTKEAGTDNYSPTFTDENATGVWQVIRLAVDSHIAGRRLVDSSIAYPDGSLINQFRKVVQDPFAEFYTDTYGDQFYFIARQPPFTKSHITNMLYGQIAASVDDPNGLFQQDPETKTRDSAKPKKIKGYAKGSGFNAGGFTFYDINKGQELDTVTFKAQKLKDYVITIQEEDVIGDSLSFNSDPCYSVYEIEPKASLIATGETFVIHFEEYGQVYGTKRLSIDSQYVPYQGTNGFNKDKDANYIAEQIAEDLVYLIESNMYLPFTRRGSITIDGDRRIKRGTWIRLASTKEIFYVTAVSHNYRIGSEVDRQTVLSVERGMVESYVKTNTTNYEGSFVSGVSYFNLINLELVKNLFVSYLTGDSAANTKYAQELKQNGAVNKKIFTFFQRRRQYVDEVKLLKSTL